MFTAGRLRNEKMAQSTASPNLILHTVSKRFGGLQAISNLELEVPAGKIMSLIGPNGAGKTTVFNMITGVYPPTSGKITCDGRRIDHLTSHRIIGRGIARTFQNIRLFQSMTVLENVQVGCHCRTRSGPFRALFKTAFERKEEAAVVEKAMGILAFMDIEDLHNEYAGNLSYGAQRRLEIARALATDPKILLLDEPAAGMNARETKELDDLIVRLRDQENIAILLIEHDMKLVMSLSDRIYVVDYGRKIAEGTPQEIKRNDAVIKAYLGEEVDA